MDGAAIREEFLHLKFTVFLWEHLLKNPCVKRNKPQFGKLINMRKKQLIFFCERTQRAGLKPSQSRKMNPERPNFSRTHNLT